MKLYIVKNTVTGKYLHLEHCHIVRWVEIDGAAIYRTFDDATDAGQYAFHYSDGLLPFTVEEWHAYKEHPRYEDYPPAMAIVYGSDWEGLYHDGELVEQGHTISAYQALRACGYTVNMRRVSDEWMQAGGLPKNLEDVKE